MASFLNLNLLLVSGCQLLVYFRLASWVGADSLYMSDDACSIFISYFFCPFFGDDTRFSTTRTDIDESNFHITITKSSQTPNVLTCSGRSAAGQTVLL